MSRVPNFVMANQSFDLSGVVSQDYICTLSLKPVLYGDDFVIHRNWRRVRMGRQALQLETRQAIFHFGHRRNPLPGRKGIEAPTPTVHQKSGRCWGGKIGHDRFKTHIDDLADDETSKVGPGSGNLQMVVLER
jgi:hypothetical protein